MYLKYGSYQHPTGTASLVDFNVRPRFSTRGFRISNIATAHVQGDLVLAQGEDQYDLSNKIIALSAAFEYDGYDFGLYHDNGTPTPHFLQSAHVQNLTGNRVIYKSFPKSYGAEYASGRSFAYAISAEFLVPDSIVLDYRETITHTGTTGPRRVWRQRPRQAPFYEYTHPSSLQRIVQRGQATSLLTYLAPPGPIFGAPYEDETQRTIQRIGPRRHPQGYTEYTVRWQYVFDSNVIGVAFPGVI